MSKTRGKMKPKKKKGCAKQPVTLDQAPFDLGASGQANRVGLKIERVKEDGGEIKRARRVDLLEFWQKRGSISADGLWAGEQLRNAFEATMKSPSAIPDNHRVQSSAKPDQAIAVQIDRQSKFSRIMALVADDDRRIINACVVGKGHPSAVYGSFRVREGFAHLSAALDRLAEALRGPRKTSHPFRGDL